MMEPHLISSSSRKTSIEQLPTESKPLTTSMGDVQGT